MNSVSIDSFMQTFSSSIWVEMAGSALSTLRIVNGSCNGIVHHTVTKVRTVIDDIKSQLINNKYNFTSILPALVEPLNGRIQSEGREKPFQSFVKI